MSSLQMIRLIKLCVMSCVGNVAYLQQMTNPHNRLVLKTPKEMIDWQKSEVQDFCELFELFQVI